MARTMLYMLGSSFLLMLCLSISSLMVAEADEISSVCLNCSLCGSCQPKLSPPAPYIQPPPPPAQVDCPPSSSGGDNTPAPPHSELPYYNYGASCPFLMPGLATNVLCFSINFPLFFGELL